MCLAVAAEAEALDQLWLAPEPYTQFGAGGRVNWILVDSLNTGREASVALKSERRIKGF
jgi:hypothetical protein